MKNRGGRVTIVPEHFGSMTAFLSVVRWAGPEFVTAPNNCDDFE